MKIGSPKLLLRYFLVLNNPNYTTILGEIIQSLKPSYLPKNSISAQASMQLGLILRREILELESATSSILQLTIPEAIEYCESMTERGLGVNHSCIHLIAMETLSHLHLSGFYTVE